VKIAERFIGNLFTNLEGYATGPLQIIGLGPDAKYIGKMKLEDAGLKVIFTQCYYKINDAEITFKENELDLGQLKLIDTVTHNTATLINGTLKHNGWRNLVYNIKAEVDDEPMLLLNTTRKDNSSFYGYALGTGSFSLTGPQTNMRIKIVGKASDKDSSYITIPNTTGKESGIADFLIERKKGKVDFNNQVILLELLHLFMKYPGETFSKEAIVKKIWNQEYSPVIHDNKIYVTIKRLRKMIEPDYNKPKYIFRAKNGYFFNKASRVRLNVEER